MQRDARRATRERQIPSADRLPARQAVALTCVSVTVFIVLVSFSVRPSTIAVAPVALVAVPPPAVLVVLPLPSLPPKVARRAETAAGRDLGLGRRRAARPVTLI